MWPRFHSRTRTRMPPGRRSDHGGSAGCTSSRPPRWAKWLLTHFHPDDTLEEVEGDLEEFYTYWYERAGRTQATLRYLLNVASVLPPFVRRRQRSKDYTKPSNLHPDMIRNYVKIAWRNLRNQAAYSMLNIFGLALGLTSCLLMALYVADELSFDRFHENANRIFRINTYAKFGGTVQDFAEAADPIGPTLRQDYPQVEEYVRFYKGNGSRLIKKGKEYIEETRTIYADSTLFRVFTLPVLAGNLQTALSRPLSVVISESMANKYFGNLNALGQTLDVDKVAYTVSAVIEDIPHNAHFHFDFIFPMSGLNYGWGNFLTTNFQTYILLKKGVDHQAFNRNFAQIIKKYIYPLAKNDLHLNSPEDFNRGDNRFTLTLQPLTDIHFHSDRQYELEPNGSSQFVHIFLAVAIFVLLIACVNFMNLSTARSSGRAKEVGIRKVLGTDRKALIGQFLTESTLMVLVSLVLAVGMATMVMPFFNNLSGKELSVYRFFTPQILPFLLLVPIVVGLLAGSYPSFYLSNFQPVSVLKNKTGGRLRGNTFRSVLVVFQFVASIILIIGTIVVYRQLAYIQTKNIGFAKDQVLIIDGTQALGEQTEAFRKEVVKLPGVMAGTVSGFLPISPGLRNGYTYSRETNVNHDNMLATQSWTVDDTYLETMGMKLANGRNFSPVLTTGAKEIIINESMAKLLGYRNPVGQPLYTLDRNQKPFTIIGVVKDFHYESLRQTIGPLCLVRGQNSDRTAFRVMASATGAVLKQVESLWKTMAPEARFHYRFMDEAFDAMYRSEQRVGKIALTFAGLAILIACLGLFGLATYIAEQRTKEIGVRKVLGASVANIASLLSTDFLKLVFIALLIASPIAWYILDNWLEDFAYKIRIEWWMFALSGLLAVGIALLTVSFQSIKAALVNPVKSLRSE